MINKIISIVIQVTIIINLISCKEIADKDKLENSKDHSNSNIKIDTTLISDSASSRDNINTVKLKKFYIRDENRIKWYGFKDYDENILINPIFKYVEIFKNGYARVFINEKWGLINKKGEYVVKPEFQYVSDLENNFVLVNENGYWGYLDRNFRMKIKPKYEAASQFNNGKAMVKLNADSLALIDTLGNKILLFSHYPDTNNNKFKDLSKYEINKILRPNSSYGNLRTYIKNHLEIDDHEIFFMRRSIYDGEGYGSVVFQNLQYGVKYYGSVGWESSKCSLRIPGISLEDGIDLAIQIVGNRLRHFSSENKTVKLDMSDVIEHYILVRCHEKGFIELVEISSS